MDYPDPLTDVLSKIERGEISAEEGLIRLKKFESRLSTFIDRHDSPHDDHLAVDPIAGKIPMAAGQPVVSQANVIENPEIDEDSQDELERDIIAWKRWWIIPFWLGVAITVLGAGLMYAGFLSAGFSWGFWLSWLPFLLGSLLMYLAWRSQTSHWLHIRIHQKPGAKPASFAISFPLPLAFGAWLLRNFGHFIPQISGQEIDGILETLDRSLSTESPFYVHVNEDDEDVIVCIG